MAYTALVTVSTATCWDLIRSAAHGAGEARERFVLRYGPVVQAFLAARLRVPAGTGESADAFQEVFLECLKAGGALERAAPRRAGGFRAFLFGVARNVCARIEERRARRATAPTLEAAIAENEPGEPDDAAREFDRAWARTTMRVAAEEHVAWAAGRGAAAERRVRLLRLRFQDGMPIRDIAASWGEDPAKVHRDYLQARREFTAILRRIVAEEMGCSEEAEISSECRALLARLGQD